MSLSRPPKLKPLRALWDARFETILGGAPNGRDAYRLCGMCEFQNIMTSTPYSFDEKTMIMVTASGSQYKIKTFSDSKEKVIAEINACIERGSFDVM